MILKKKSIFSGKLLRVYVVGLSIFVLIILIVHHYTTKICDVEYNRLIDEYKTYQQSDDRKNGTDEKKYHSITSIKGANVIENPDLGYRGNKGDPFLPHEYLQNLKKSNKIFVLGSVDSALTVRVEKDDVMYISTFDLKISECIKNCENIDVIKVIAVASFSKEEKEFDIWGNFYSEKSDGLFILSELNGDESNIVIKDNDSIRLIDYADYYLETYYSCEDKRFNYYGYDILIDDIRDGVDENYRILPEGGDLTGLTVTFLNKDFDCLITDINVINQVKEYLNSLNLRPVYSAHKLGRDTKEWKISFSYSNRDEINIYQDGYELIMNEAGECKEIDVEQGKLLEEILARIDNKLIN